MVTDKDKGGFLSGIVQLLGILLFIFLLYEAVKWVINSSIGEKIILLIVLVVFYLLYSWSTTLM